MTVLGKTSAPNPRQMEEKLWGERDDLLLTVELVEAANLTI